MIGWGLRISEEADACNHTDFEVEPSNREDDRLETRRKQEALRELGVVDFGQGSLTAFIEGIRGRLDSRFGKDVRLVGRALLDGGHWAERRTGYIENERLLLHRNAGNI